MESNRVWYTYMTVDFVSGKYYVGRHTTCNIFDKYRGSGNFIKKYPKSKLYRLHTYILEFFNSDEELSIGEQKLLDTHFGLPNCKNLHSLSTGFATGKDNPQYKLTKSQRKELSDNHWTKTPEGRQWISDNNPSKMDGMREVRSQSQKKNWENDEYRDKYTGKNHWTNQNNEMAVSYRKEMRENNIAKRPDVRLKLQQPRGKYKTITCPYCNKEGQDRIMHRWHFANCKNK